MKALQAKLNQETLRADRAETADRGKADCLASISHRIRTQLNAIAGFTDLALKTDLQPELREYLDTVRMSADWLMEVANDLLEFAQMEAGVLELAKAPFSLPECIVSAISMVERDIASKKLSSDCKLDPQLPEMVIGDARRFRHLVFNLLDNAVRFTTRGGVIISADVDSQSADEAVIRIVVADTGMGIPPEKRALIFEPFQQGEIGGSSRSGIELAISRRLVHLMGGTIEFQSQLGAGSRFELTLPVRKYHDASETVNDLPGSERIAVSNLSVLVADDNTMNRRLTSKILESAGHRVRTAVNGKEAVEKAQSERFDLILMDMEMPDLNGLDATRAIRAAEPSGGHVAIYALTAHACAADRESCLNAGMDGFLTKPLAPHELIHLISKLTPGASCAVRFEPTLVLEGEPVHFAAHGEAGVPADASEDVFGSFVDEALREETEDASEVALDALLKTPADAVFEPEPDPAELIPAAPVEAGTPVTLFADAEQEPEIIEETEPVPVAVGLVEASERISSFNMEHRLRTEAIRANDLFSKAAPEKTDLQEEQLTGERDPFEQARKALSRSRFDVRVIHNNGDPSDRNFI
jgi:CheY-like chemotaxis protein/nitrogen-specific signal transduction histidine kinase